VAVSLKGVIRKHLDTVGNISVKETVFDGSIPSGTSLRAKLVAVAREEFSFSFSECIYGGTAAFQQEWSHIRVRIRLDPDAGISAATINTLSTTWQNGIESTWSNKWGVGRPGELTCVFTFEVEWVADGQHHTVRVRPGPARSNQTTWDTMDSGSIAAHEFGHMLGLNDEYTDKNCPDRSPVNSGTVMDNNSNNVPARMMRTFASNIDSDVVTI
jgi:hypothetical protein